MKARYEAKVAELHGMSTFSIDFKKNNRCDVGALRPGRGGPFRLFELGPCPHAVVDASTSTSSSEPMEPRLTLGGAVRFEKNGVSVLHQQRLENLVGKRGVVPWVAIKSKVAAVGL